MFNASPPVPGLTFALRAHGRGRPGPAAATGEHIRDTLPWLLRCGFLVQQGRGMTASFKASGQGMERQRITEEQLQERRREPAALRSQRERAARLQRTRGGA